MMERRKKQQQSLRAGPSRRSGTKIKGRLSARNDALKAKMPRPPRRVS